MNSVTTILPFGMLTPTPQWLPHHNVFNEWTWEQWQWNESLRNAAKVQHYWSLTIRLFSIVFRRLVGGGVLPLCREAFIVFCDCSWLDQCLIELLVIHSNTWNYLTLLTYIYKSYSCKIYVYIGFGIEWPTSVDMP